MTNNSNNYVFNTQTCSFLLSLYMSGFICKRVQAAAHEQPVSLDFVFLQPQKPTSANALCSDQTNKFSKVNATFEHHVS